jgi:hypothetical protein
MAAKGVDHCVVSTVCPHGCGATWITTTVGDANAVTTATTAATATTTVPALTIINVVAPVFSTCSSVGC